jgi:hypothetical protein
MSKLSAILTASIFAFATTGALASDDGAKTGPGTAPRAKDLRVNCNDVKNKDHATCKAAAKSASREELKRDKKDDMKKQNND